MTEKIEGSLLNQGDSFVLSVDGNTPSEVCDAMADIITSLGLVKYKGLFKVTFSIDVEKI